MSILSLSVPRTVLSRMDTRLSSTLLLTRLFLQWYFAAQGTNRLNRPTMIGSAAALGVAIPKEATLFVIATFVGLHTLLAPNLC